MRNYLYLITILLFSTGCSETKKNKKYYQTQLCNKLDGVMEYKLKDNTRVDCLTNKYAIEVDWVKK